MISLFCYVFIYCNINEILDANYYSHFHIEPYKNPLITDEPHFYYSIITINQFTACIYAIYIFYNIMFSKSLNKFSLTLAFIYLKHILYILLISNIDMYHYECNRVVMWAFTTPILLKMYCITNNLSLRDIKAYYHIVPCVSNLFMIPFKYTNTNLYYIYLGYAYISLALFMKTLYNQKSNKFTNIFLTIWGVFMIINIVEHMGIVPVYNIHIYFMIADIIGKLTGNIIIHDYNEQDQIIKDNIDLQSIQFISHIVKIINKYKKENLKITDQCYYFIDNMKRKLLSNIPENKDFLKKELLKKILPFDFDNEYIKINDSLTTTTINNKRFDMVCVLFTDIVSYTELAKKYDEKTIFKPLNSIYTSFDNITKKYSHLQKIETIGDAYMVVGDIYCSDPKTNETHKTAVYEIILLAIEFTREIKKIKTPDNTPLNIRVGINIGSVAVGILGNEIPRLCVVGNAVNVASRLQSTAEENTIQLSRHIHDVAKDLSFSTIIDYAIKENVFLKNIGTVNTYNIKPDEKYSDLFVVANE